MPFVGKKLFVPAKPVKDVKSDETIYTIPHTKEQFRSKTEYKNRKLWYEDRIWTCRCTGHVNLSHEEAWNSEKSVKKSLKQQFQPCHEKTVLELVHHGTVSLDTLVDQAWLKIQQVLSMGEKVAFKVKAAGKVIKGTIIKIDTAGIDANPTSNCNSPSSSDKENENLEDSPKKWIPPKLLPYKYSIRLDGEDKIINEVPANDLNRQEKPPSKELLRLFIRSHAMRLGQNQTSPWVVDEGKVKQYSLPGKFADFILAPFILSPPQMNGTPGKSRDESSKKRKLSSPAVPVSKKAKIDKINNSKKSHDVSHKHQRLLSPFKSVGSKIESPKKKSPKKPSSDTIEIDSESEEDQPLSALKSSPRKSPLKKASKIESDSDDSDDEVLLVKSSSKKSPFKKSSEKKKDKSSKRKDKESSLKKKVKEDKKSIPVKKKSSSKGAVDSDSDEDKPLAKIKSMKQMTLFDMSKKKGMKTPEKKHSSTKLNTPEKRLKTPDKKINISPPKTPAIVSKLLKAVKSDNQQIIKPLVLKAATLLTPSQQKRLPMEIKDMVQQKFEFLEERKKLKNMSAEEREKYLNEKRNIRKQKMREKQKELKKKFEDQDLSQKPLPQPKLVPTPDGIPNELFGDIAMVTEFISCYGGLLMPEEQFPILSDALLKAISNGKEGFTYLSRALVVLLQTLLQDGISEDYQEIKVPLSDIPVNSYTASELVRLCLRKQDVDEEADEDEEDSEDTEVPDDVIQQLESQELFQLEPSHKIQILKGLCLRIMGTYSVQDYMETKQKEAGKLWKKKLGELKQKNDIMRKEKQQKKEEKEKIKDENETKNDLEQKEGLLISHFYGKSSDHSESSKPGTPEPPSADSADEGDDLISVVKRRRQLAAKSAAEKEQRDKERRIQKEKEYEQYRKLREKENFEKTFNEGIALAKMVLRQTPIGTDRNHNRYWIFSSTTPGLFIEKGYVDDYIEYNVPKATDMDSADSSSDEEESDTASSVVGPVSSAADNIERTAPKCGQNLWFTYDSVKDLDNLLESLHPQGYRESALKAVLKKQYADISKAINAFKRTNAELRDSDGEKEMLEGFRKELMETELRLRNGGLGGVEEFAAWEARLETASKVPELGKLMIETQESIMEKFRQGSMSPKKKKVKVETVEVKEEGDEENEKDDEEEVEEKTEILGIKLWREAVESSNTLSRLHVLLGVLDSCIKWEKSAENAKCKICRKKGNDDRLLLCDDCNQAFHIFCLRPALSEIPKGDWFCAACVPQDKRRMSRIYKTDEFDSDSGGEEQEHDENCTECGGDEDLIFCAECPAAYHLECHDPPLRRPPRGRWVCTECKCGVKRKTRSRTQKRSARKQKKAPPKRKRYTEESSESEEEEEEAEESSGEEEEEEDDGESSSQEEECSRPRKVARTSRQQTSVKAAAEKNKPGRRSNTASHKETKSPRTSTGANTSIETKSYASRRAPSDLSICEDIINDVMSHESCWPFLYAVNKKDVPDYHKIIKHPMEFQTVKNKLSVLVYGSVDEMMEDVKLIFINAETYNKDGSDVLQCKEQIEKYFTSLMKKKLPSFPYYRARNVNGVSDDTSYNKRTRR